MNCEMVKGCPLDGVAQEDRKFHADAGQRGSHGKKSEGQGGPGGRGKNGGRDTRSLLEEKFQGNENAQILFVGSVNCLRHRPYMVIGKYMQEGRAAILSPAMSDFSSGRYIKQIEEAIIELSNERNTKDFVLLAGCQWIILSTDGDLICQKIKEEHDINLTISVDAHLEYGNHE